MPNKTISSILWLPWWVLVLFLSMQGNGYFLILLRGHGERTEVLVFVEEELSALSLSLSRG